MNLSAMLKRSLAQFSSPTPTGPLQLEVEGLVARHGPVEALHGVSLRVAPGESVAILGANGAGKTTLLRCISGSMRARAGVVCFAGVHLTGLAPHNILRLGLAHVPEGRQVFTQQTVLENLLLGGLIRNDKVEARRDMESLLNVFPALREKLHRAAGELSGGQQQMLAIARGIMANPKLLLLDEPSLGLSPILVDELTDLIQQLKEERAMGILLVEQNAFMAAELTERVYVMRNGLIGAEYTSEEVLGNRDLIDAYLGGRSDNVGR